MRQIAATRHRDRLLQQIASCDMWNSLSLRSVARIRSAYRSDKISTSSLVAIAVQTRRLVAAICPTVYLGLYRYTNEKITHMLFLSRYVFQAVFQLEFAP